jgi:hypothetical protein
MMYVAAERCTGVKDKACGDERPAGCPAAQTAGPPSK